MRHPARHDEALAWLAPYGPDLAWGFTNHHPMVVEALCALGRGEAALAWLEAHRDGLVPKDGPSERIEGDGREALGCPARFADWEARIQGDLARGPWRAVVAEWAARLAPGAAGAATHGLIRTAHAARALVDADSELRRAELAAGIAYWAATYQQLPAAAADVAEAGPASEALRGVPMIRDTRPEAGSIVDAFRSLDACPAFASVIHRLDVTRDPDAVVGELTATFSAVLLANAEDRLGAVVFTHGVTSAATLRTLLPLLPEGARRPALRYVWQAGAALLATYGHALPAGPPPSGPGPERSRLVDAALVSGDDHAIKLTEACLAEHARDPLPVYLLAAERGIALLSAG